MGNGLSLGQSPSARVEAGGASCPVSGKVSTAGLIKVRGRLRHHPPTFDLELFGNRPVPSTARETASFLQPQRSFTEASVTPREVLGWGTWCPCLGLSEAHRAQAQRRSSSESAARGGGAGRGCRRGARRSVRRLPAGLAKESEPPSGTAGPKANSRGRPRAGIRSHGPVLASGEMSLSRPHHPNLGCTPRPLPSTSAPTSSTPGAGSSLRLRGTTQDRPAGRPPRPHPLGHARKALGPRVRPRHPPGGPRESTARVSPGPAQRSRPPRLSRLLRPRPRRAFQACTRTGRGTWDHPAPSRGP